jgi:hypothetical protein
LLADMSGNHLAMRIALIAPPWYTIPPSGYGGIEWVVALLADGLTDRGHEVTVFAAPGSDTRAGWSRRSTRSRPATPSATRGTRPAIGRVGELDPHRMGSWVVERFSAEAMVAGYEGAHERAVAGEQAAAG